MNEKTNKIFTAKLGRKSWEDGGEEERSRYN